VLKLKDLLSKSGNPVGKQKKTLLLLAQEQRESGAA
jgi:hypothetical protein